MSLAQLKPESFADQIPHRRRPEQSASLEAMPAGSHARALQERLVASHGGELASDFARWSPRRSLALIAAASFALWFAMLEVGVQAVHAIA